MISAHIGYYKNKNTIIYSLLMTIDLKDTHQEKFY